jgi:hypothetical protein
MRLNCHQVIRVGDDVVIHGKPETCGLDPLTNEQPQSKPLPKKASQSTSQVIGEDDGEHIPKGRNGLFVRQRELGPTAHTSGYLRGGVTRAVGSSRSVFRGENIQRPRSSL